MVFIDLRLFLESCSPIFLLFSFKDMKSLELVGFKRSTSTITDNSIQSIFYQLFIQFKEIDVCIL